jgi:hypothetical protein
VERGVGRSSQRIDPMYFVSVVLLLAILPALSVILEAALSPHGVSIMRQGREVLRVLGLRRSAGDLLFLLITQFSVRDRTNIRWHFIVLLL